MYVEAIFTLKCLKAITWPWGWLLHRLSKHQSPTTTLFRAPVTHTIIFSQGMLHLRTNHSLITCFLHIAKTLFYISIGWEEKLNALIFSGPIQSFYTSIEPSSFLKMTYMSNYCSSWNPETHQEDDGGHRGVAWIVHHGKCFRHVAIAGCHKHQPESKSLQWLHPIKLQANIYLTTVK